MPLSHTPVLFEPTIELLKPEGNGLYLDGTFGGGGHSRGILESGPDVRLVALDQDPQAKVRAEALASEFGGRFRFYDLNFGQLDQVEETNFDGMLFDLGLSSFQLDEAERGFAFKADAPVDMRMDPRVGRSAAEFLEEAEEAELVRAVRDLGEEKMWKRVVKALMQARGTGQLQRTGSLAKLIEDTLGPAVRRKMKIHPATKTFQGIRMAVNEELEVLERMLPIAMEKLAAKGVLAVISFHSLEDRMVKRFFRKMAGKAEHAGDTLPEQLKESQGTLLTRKAISASEEEIASNPRSRSARLRALQKH